MGNDLIQYKTVDDFARAVYDRLTIGVDKLDAGEQVDAVLSIDQMLAKATSYVREHLYGHAEQQQTTVMQENASAYTSAAQDVLRATKSGDLDTVDLALQKSIDATLECKNAATRLKQIKERKSLIGDNATPYARQIDLRASH